MARARPWARRVTFALITLPLVIAIPNFVGLIAHTRTDSELGIMMYGFPIFIGLVFGTPIVCISTAVWGLGLRKSKQAGEKLPRWELVIFGIIAAFTAMVLALSSENYLRILKQLF